MVVVVKVVDVVLTVTVDVVDDDVIDSGGDSCSGVEEVHVGG